MLTLADFPDPKAFNDYVRTLSRLQVQQAGAAEYARLRRDMLRAAAATEIHQRDARATEQALSRHKDKP